MKATHLLTIFVLAIASLIGCDAQKISTDSDSPEAQAVDPHTDDAHSDDTPAQETHQPGSDVTSHHATTAMDLFHQMDSRKPVPLTPMMANHQLANMRDHLLAVQEIIGAAARNDFDAMEAAAQRLGSSPQMAQMCNHMGAGAPGFTELALGFHETADGIIAAAQANDHDAAMLALEDTLATCTSCHAQYKQQVVTDDVWQRITSSNAPSEDMHDMHQMHHGGH